MIFDREKRVPAEKLTEALLRKHPVWEFCNDDEAGETLVRPVKELPITSAANRLLTCQFKLADGAALFGYVGNLSLSDEEQNQHFLTVSVFYGGMLEHLARYHDAWYETEGPVAFAAKLGKSETAVFPISYDVSAIVIGKPNCVRGNITRDPKTRLSREALMKLVLQSL